MSSGAMKKPLMNNPHQCNVEINHLVEELVRYGLSWAKSANLEIEASCRYVQKFL
ncbi:hypothetical protein Sps_05606 [Shewanella psychrophila]|uniref:Uncharacterized protein n=1 Tax=Shewanella psychrophila TaxID=225848 RepID=A0A1S6HYT6_9GAMM|nr:hypothetical protein Sps_05606 [Shewanella psychrophila]